ncbi:MAG TPA: rhomboid family intramembrane serine protease [Chryseosolibacter sp.]|nr:rhomboid family intramembrane serine protease [Chryseosolibacter sp.]
MDKSAGAIKVLIIVCVIFFVITEFVPDMKTFMFETFALYFPGNEHFRIWQFVSNIFMHGGFAHIFFNMYALWAFGSPLEQMWGRNKFLVFFFLAGIGAAIIYTLVNYFQFNNLYNDLIGSGASQEDINTFLQTGKYNVAAMSGLTEEKLDDFWQLFNIPVVGASGAIYGVLVAFGFLFPNAKLFLIFLPIPIAAKYFIPVLIGIDLFSGVTGFSIFGGNVAHFGHVGGAVIGLLLMLYWRKHAMRHRRPFDPGEYNA